MVVKQGKLVKETDSERSHSKHALDRAGLFVKREDRKGPGDSSWQNYILRKDHGSPPTCPENSGTQDIVKVEKRRSFGRSKNVKGLDLHRTPVKFSMLLMLYFSLSTIEL